MTRYPDDSWIDQRIDEFEARERVRRRGGKPDEEPPHPDDSAQVPPLDDVQAPPRKPAALQAAEKKPNLRPIDQKWQELYVQAAARGPGKDPLPAVMGMDIGGTKIHYSLYALNDGKIADRPIFSLEAPTAKGIKPLADAYSNALGIAMQQAADRGYMLVGVGIGAPGRYISKKQYEERYGKVRAKHLEQTRGLGVVTVPSTGDDQLPWQPSIRSVIAPGSAANLGSKPDEFDGVALESVLQRLTPSGVQVVVNNDAALQLKASVDQYRSDPEKSRFIQGRTIVYIAPGTGLGGAVINKNGELVTDGHYQYMKLARRSKQAHSGSDKDELVYDILADPSSKFISHPQDEPTITPERMLSGSGMAEILRSVYNDDSITTKTFDKYYKEFKASASVDDADNEAIDTMRSVGRYMADMVEALHKGRFDHLDRRSDWTDADKSEVRGFDTLLFSGGASGAEFFRELVVPEMQRELIKKGMHVDVVFAPENAVELTAHAAAGTVSAAQLAQPLVKTREHNRRLGEQTREIA